MIYMVAVANKDEVSIARGVVTFQAYFGILVGKSVVRALRECNTLLKDGAY